jgi:signal transduction histidine kinase
MVHGAVKQSGGFITVDSVPTKGATFTIYLPQLSERADESDLRIDADTIH